MHTWYVDFVSFREWLVNKRGTFENMTIMICVAYILIELKIECICNGIVSMCTWHAWEQRTAKCHAWLDAEGWWLSWAWHACGCHSRYRGWRLTVALRVQHNDEEARQEEYAMQQAILNVQCVQLPQLWHVIMHLMYNWGFHVTWISCLSKVGMSWIAYVARGSHLDHRARISAWPTWLHPPCGCEPPATRVHVRRNWQHYLACHLAQCHCLREVARASCDDGVTNTTLRRLLALWDDAVVHAQDVARAVPPWHASRGLGEPPVDMYHEVLTSKAIVEYWCDRA